MKIKKRLLLTMACASFFVIKPSISLAQNDNTPSIKIKTITGYNNTQQTLYSDMFYTKSTATQLNKTTTLDNDTSIFGVGIEAEFTNKFGAEIRQYFGSDKNSNMLKAVLPDTNNYIEIENPVAMTNATAFLFNYQTPNFYGLNGYGHLGYASSTNKILDTKLESTGIAYGFGIELEINNDISIYMDSLILDSEDYEFYYTTNGSIDQLTEDNEEYKYSGSIKNSLYSFGVVFKF